ncbi:MAG: PP2C family serine/threonine-protein phosphatase [Hyphomicrobiales bacterium]|nr:PP2C family serine/threonine-protein phosphatase [Hyphomicrobiales bacterium]
MTGLGWKIAAASALGTSHAKIETPCQDSFSTKLFRDRVGGDVLVAAVSDGAGSAKKAEQGSWLTCATIVEAAEIFLADGGLVGDIRRETAADWIRMAQAAIDIRAENEGATRRDYACTLLVAVVGEDAAAIFQVGDGAVVVPDDITVSDDVGWSWVHWPQHGEFANTTYFVTDERVDERMMFELCTRRIDEIALFTDGIERLVLHEASKTVFAPFFNRMLPAVRRLAAPGLDRKLSTDLEQYLNSPMICEKTDDDKTLVLATRRAPVEIKAATTPTFGVVSGEARDHGHED